MRWNYEYPKPGDPAYAGPQPWKVYTDSLRVLFRIEATLRVFVYTVLKTDFRDEWMTKPTIPDFDPENGIEPPAVKASDSEPNEVAGSESSEPANRRDDSKARTGKTIQVLARRSQGIRHGFEFVDPRPQSPLQELTLRQLLMLIEANPRSFAPFFPGFDRAKVRLREIAELRNRFAHFRPLKTEDVVRLMRNAQDVLGTAEDYVGAMLSYGTRLVPPDSDENWYHHMQGALDPSLSPKFFLHGMRVPGRRDSLEYQWVTIQIEHRTTALETAATSSRRRKYLIPNLRTPRILQTHPSLAAYAICLREARLPDDQHGYAIWDKESERYIFGKCACLTFPLSSLRTADAHIPLAAALSGLSIHLLSEEQSLRWSRHNQTALLDPTPMHDDDITGEGEDFMPESCVLLAPQADDPVEYWGEIRASRHHFITDSRSIPWAGQIES